MLKINKLIINLIYLDEQNLQFKLLNGIFLYNLA